MEQKTCQKCGREMDNDLFEICPECEEVVCPYCYNHCENICIPCIEKEREREKNER